MTLGDITILKIKARIFNLLYFNYQITLDKKQKFPVKL